MVRALAPVVSRAAIDSGKSLARPHIPTEAIRQHTCAFLCATAQDRRVRWPCARHSGDQENTTAKQGISLREVVPLREETTCC